MKKNIMNKFIITFITFFIYTRSTLGFTGDILYTKYNYTPVLSSLNKDTKVIGILNKGYIILDDGDFEDYIKVKLTDESDGYILKNNLGLFNESPYKIGGNYGSLSSESDLYSLPFTSAHKDLNLTKGTNFYILHVNFINSKWIKVKIASGKDKGKIGYLQKDNVSIENIEGFENDITKFINNYSKKEDIKPENTSQINSDYINIKSSTDSGSSIKNINGSGVNIQNSNSSGSKTKPLQSSGANIQNNSSSSRLNVPNINSSGSNIETNSGSSDENLDELIKSLNSIIK